ncbi:hypothetical protein GCHA_3661 [Paraglaciecola chathamensis S18K6]|uniref:Lipoprotein n=1 Tax=Paraglaciecola chathamensis S18K6 TaxID=1127672 RepID=A0AAV3V447_9ALTE|nr:hypothetical protein GCHA_3661 [Paraglaciecola chathamensis S18K6]
MDNRKPITRYSLSAFSISCTASFLLYARHIEAQVCWQGL